MSSAKRFEDLWIWQQARELVEEIYSDFGPGTPGERDFGFRDQIQKAGISIMNNIAEGFERKTDKEFARFLDIAKGSCGEVRSMYYAAMDLNYVNNRIAEKRQNRAKQISGGISKLASHLRTSKDYNTKKSNGLKVAESEYKVYNFRNEDEG